MEVVRDAHGVTVDGVVTCGDLPDLRSLTMPLTEELDIEVETLDSLEGFDLTKSALGDRATEYAPALRLAAAATAVPPTGRSHIGRWRKGAAAAAILLVVGGTWFAVSMSSRRPGTAPRSTPQVPPAPAATTGGADAQPAVVPLVPSGAAISASRTPRASAEPAPTLHSVLLGPGRRLAILNGAIVGVGDTVGRRTVTRIESDAVFLRDASGAEIKVAVPPLKPGTNP
jgi:hypothetical protein